MYDILLIGGGPAGLSAALSASRLGLDYLTLERAVIADTIYRFPIARTLFSTADELVLESGDFEPKHKPTREQLLSHYVNTVCNERLKVLTGSEVLNISRSAGGVFTVTATSGVYSSRAVLYAAGGFGKQRKLEVPGEDDSRVSYRFSEAHPYALKHILIVGGGNSAAEAAIWLAEVGAQVTLALRRGSLDLSSSDKERSADRVQIKPWVRQPLDLAIERGQVRLLTSAKVMHIGRHSTSVLLQSENAGLAPTVEDVRCDHIFALIGADPDARLLEEAGAGIAGDGRPFYDPDTNETTVAGLYVAGHITREKHIKNAITTGRRVVENIGAQLLADARPEREQFQMAGLLDQG
jgi:thioredoxin reductase (NADPH)